MTKTKNIMQKYAMNFGTYMGIFWIAKFILFPLGFKMPFLMLLYTVLTLGVPFMGYYYVKMYRQKICNDSITFAHACIFTLMMYVFASMLASVAHFLYFQFIDQGFVLEQYTLLVNQMVEINQAANANADLSMFNQALEQLSSLNASDFTLQLLSSDIFFCTFLAIPTALLVMKNPKPNNQQIAV